jgi:hypothetical protein
MTKTIAAAVAAGVLASLAAAGSATTSPSGVAATARSATPQLAARALKAGLPDGPTAAALRQAAQAGAAAALQPTTFAGFSFCQDPMLRTWAAYDPTHQATLSREFTYTTPTGDFSTATVTPSPWYWLGTDLNNFYRFRASDFMLTLGPVSYARAVSAWGPDTRPEWDLAVNAIWYIDNGVVTYADAVPVEATGPDSTGAGSPICYFPPLP